MGTHPIFESDFDCLTDIKMGDVEELLEETEVEIFEELYFYVENLKRNREMLKMERLKARAREIFQRLEINLCFLDDELLKEFMKEYKITVQDHNLAVLRNREKLGVFAKDLVRLFARIIVDKIEEMHNFTLGCKFSDIAAKRAVSETFAGFRAAIKSSERETIEKLIQTHYANELLTRENKTNYPFALFRQQDFNVLTV